MHPVAQLRLKVKLFLKSPNLFRWYQAKATHPGLIFFKERSRSKGPFLHQHYPASQVLCPSPTPAQASTYSTVTGRYPAPGTGLPRYPSCLPDMLSSLPRWIRVGACDGFFPTSLRPSPNLGRVGIHDFTFEACSRFTRVTACQVAAA